MSVVALIPTYDDADLLRGCLESVAGCGLEAVVADGPWRLFEHGGRMHSLGIDAAVAGLPVTLLQGRLWADEAQKRTALVAHAQERSTAEWALFLDADERLEAFVGDRISTALASAADADWATLHIYRPDHRHHPSGFPLPRLLRLQPGIRFRPPRDFDVFVGDRRIAYLTGEPVAPGSRFVALPPDVARIRHERRFRSSTRNDRNARYQVRRREVFSV